MIDVLELLNEPAGYVSPAFAAVVRQYWLDGYAAVREVDSDIQIMIGDAFLGVDVWCLCVCAQAMVTNPFTQSWQNFLTYPNATGVLMDYVRTAFILIHSDLFPA